MWLLLHLTTLLASDLLSERTKDYLLEKMRVTPNISSLDDVLDTPDLRS